MTSRQFGGWKQVTTARVFSPAAAILESEKTLGTRLPLPDVRKFLTSGYACAKLTNITAHAHNGFLSLTAPLGERFYSLSSLQRVAFLGCFENAPLRPTWIH